MNTSDHVTAFGSSVGSEEEMPSVRMARAFPAVAAILLAVVQLAAAASCPNITAFRSLSVRKDFSSRQLTGFWYEQAFIDIAQIGATCQTLDSTLNATSQQVGCQGWQVCACMGIADC